MILPVDCLTIRMDIRQSFSIGIPIDGSYNYINNWSIQLGGVISTINFPDDWFIDLGINVSVPMLSMDPKNYRWRYGRGTTHERIILSKRGWEANKTLYRDMFNRLLSSGKIDNTHSFDEIEETVRTSFSKMLSSLNTTLKRRQQRLDRLTKNIATEITSLTSVKNLVLTAKSA